jgi:hypothetical protein
VRPTTEELIGGDKCPIGEFHEGRTYQLVRHDLRIRELEAELATEHDHCDRFTKERAEWKARVAELERMEEHWHNKALLLARGEWRNEAVANRELKGED